VHWQLWVLLSNELQSSAAAGGRWLVARLGGRCCTLRVGRGGVCWCCCSRVLRLSKGATDSTCTYECAVSSWVRRN
jgi:hypothetical protein